MPELSTLSLAADANLVAYWKLEDTSATTGGFTLTNNNTVAFNNAKFTKGADFGSSNSNKSLTIASDLGIGGGAFSTSLWFKSSAEISTGTYLLFSKGDAATHVNHFIGYSYNSGTRRLQFTRLKQGVSQEDIYHEITLGTDNYYHFVLTYDTSNIIAYVNGSAVESPVSSTGNGSANNFDNTTIGCGFNAGDNSLIGYTSGIIDYVSVFNRALTPSEIWSIYQFGTKSLFFAQL